MCCFTSQSTYMVMAGRSGHLTTFFSWVQLEQEVTKYFVHMHSLDSAKGRMTVEIIAWLISTKVWNCARSFSLFWPYLNILFYSHIGFGKSKPENIDRWSKTPHILVRCILLFCFVCFFCWFTSQSTTMVMGGRSVHLTILFPGQAWTSG